MIQKFGEKFGNLENFWKCGKISKLKNKKLEIWKIFGHLKEIQKFEKKLEFTNIDLNSLFKIVFI